MISINLPRTVAALFLAFVLPATPPAPGNFIYTTAGELPRFVPLLNRPEIAGAQVVYNWSLLEPAKDQYDFAPIDRDLSLVGSLHKKLFIQIQDRFFAPQARHVPRYLLTEPAFHGGLVPQTDNPGEGKPPVSGWVAQQWNPAVQQRYQLLLRALARRFDGRVYGVNLPESAIDIDAAHDKTGFTCDGYFNAELQNMAVARRAFQRSAVVQYVNFWPCEWNNDRHYMSRVFAFAAANGIGLGGPDVVPNKKAQMENSYPFFAQYKNRLPLVAMAVQDPTLTYRNPRTHRPFTRAELESFGRGYLGAQIIFWTPSAPWLQLVLGH